MLRWIFLFLLLGNAVLFFWYAQAHRFADRGLQPDIRPGLLRTPEELGPREVLTPRARTCGAFAPLPNEAEAGQLVALLERYAIAARSEPMPAVARAVRLELPLPADPASRVGLLDELALAGWVPETRDGLLVLGEYALDAEINVLVGTLPESIAQKLRTRTVVESTGEYRVQVSYLEGYQIDSEINQLLENRWPEINFEKNRCEGLQAR